MMSLTEKRARINEMSGDEKAAFLCELKSAIDEVKNSLVTVKSNDSIWYSPDEKPEEDVKCFVVLKLNYRISKDHYHANYGWNFHEDDDVYSWCYVKDLIESIPGTKKFGGE